jgi:transcriptional regulator with XRE-family HTH domain
LKSEEIARHVGISVGYYSAIENGRGLPPSRETLRKVISAIGVEPDEAHLIEMMAGTERGFSLDDAELPEDALALIGDIRKHALELPPRFLKALRTRIREAVA